MFGQKDLNLLLCAILTLFGQFLYLPAGAQVTSQSRELNDQSPRERTQLTPTIYMYKPKPPKVEGDFNDFLKNLHGSYYISLMGPRLVGASNETYNVYLPDVAPIQLFHAVQLGYQASPNLQVGVKMSAVQNIADGVKGETGIVRNQSFELYDPNFYFNLPNLVKVPGWNVFTSASFSLSLTKASEDIGKVTSLTFAQSWTVNNFPSDWTYGFSVYLNPQFYTDPAPPGTIDRQTLAASIGHILAYRVSSNFSLQTSTSFDVEHRSPNSQGFFHLGDGLEDRFRMSCEITPNISPLFLSIGGYFQFMIWRPEAETSIFGADLSIGF